MSNFWFTKIAIYWKSNSWQSWLDWKSLVQKEAHKICKQYKNLLSTLSKTINNFIFQGLKTQKIHGNNMTKNKQTGKNSNHTFPLQSQLIMWKIYNLSHITNALNNYFAKTKIVLDFQSSVTFSQKKYFNQLSLLTIKSFFVKSIASTHVSKIISPLNLEKSDEPDSIPTIILKLLNKNK